MIKFALVAASAVAILAATAGIAGADQTLNDLVTPESIAAFCADKPVGSELTATITMPDNTTMTGKIECEAEAISGGGDSSAISGLDTEDDVSGVSEEGDDNGGVNSGDGEDSGDDNSGSGSGDGGGNAGGNDD